LDGYSLKYKDVDEDLVNVSDDEDLVTAYGVSGDHMKGILKIQVIP